VKFRLVLAALLGLSLCACINTQPPQSHVTASGRPCHPVGYSWSPIWVAPDGKTAC
jgi:hypothetical protein